MQLNQRPVVECLTWQHWHISALGKLSRCVLAAEHAHGVCGGAQEGNALALERLDKVHILAEKAVSRMARLAPACVVEPLKLFQEAEYNELQRKARSPRRPGCTGCYAGEHCNVGTPWGLWGLTQ